MKEVKAANLVKKHMHLTTRSAGAHGKPYKVARRDAKSALKKDIRKALSEPFLCPLLA